MTEPTRARALLSTDDFKLLQDAVRFFIQQNEASADMARYANLYHRLGSVAGR
jgi:sulfur transfer complex TusBCD TusB component (DsrH family)